MYNLRDHRQFSNITIRRTSDLTFHTPTSTPQENNSEMFIHRKFVFYIHVVADSEDKEHT